MAKKKSAGILLYRFSGATINFFLVHPGGPFWAKKDHGAWSIPKGGFDDTEDALEAAKREFHEETGFQFEGTNLIALTPLKQPSGKIVHAWAAEGDCDASQIKSNLLRLEWPPKSGVIKEFPEVDRAEWFDLTSARQKLLRGQIGFLDQTLAALKISPAASA